MDSEKRVQNWIKIKSRRRQKGYPSEIQIDMDGNVYIDGELYEEGYSKFGNISIDVAKHNRYNTGEETQKILESSKTAKKGDKVVIKDSSSPDRIDNTTVIF